MNTTKAKGPCALGEEEALEAKEMTNTILLKSGSVGGSKSLFVDPKATMQRFAQSPLGLASSGSSGAFDNKMLTIDPETTANYSALKKNFAANRMMQNPKLGMNPSMSIQRLDRELSPDRNQSPKRMSESQAADKTAEQLIKELTLDLDDAEETLENLQNESLPGTCKSQFALQFRMLTEKDNANFANRKIDLMERTITKGRFPINYKTNAGSWMNDREWKKTANRNAWNGEARTEANDLAALERRRKQKVLQNTALEAQYKIVVKKPKF